MEDPLKTGDIVAHTIMKDYRIVPSGPEDLALEGLLYLYDASKKEEYLDHVSKVWDFRKQNNCSGLNVEIFQSSLHFETWLRTGNDELIKGFENTASYWKKSVYRNSEGAVCHGTEPTRITISADFLQGYAVFMARAGFLTGQEDFFKECVSQFELYRKLLRDPLTGLWAQGKIRYDITDWISMVHTSRTQGWILMGLADSMDWLPKESVYFSKLKTILNELCNDLQRYQDPRGMWHQLADFEEAYPETSGTALITHNLYKGFHRGWLNMNPFLSVAEKAITALMGFVGDNGVVLNTAQTGWKEKNIGDYLHCPSVPGDPWSVGPFLMACAGPWLAREPISMVNRK
jgi:rhamnogalacturonyl hydrolase YesR